MWLLCTSQPPFGMVTNAVLCLIKHLQEAIQKLSSKITLYIKNHMPSYLKVTCMAKLITMLVGILIVVKKSLPNTS